MDEQTPRIIFAWKAEGMSETRTSTISKATISKAKTDWHQFDTLTEERVRRRIEAYPKLAFTRLKDQRGEIVRVVDGGSQIRIWIDEKR